jgi:copper chaperone CopZ
MQTLKLKIGGMSCNHCLMRVKKALESSPGVKSAEVDLASGTATVTGEGMNVNKLISAVVAAGYTAELTV